MKLLALVVAAATLVTVQAQADRVLARDKDWTLTETNADWGLTCVGHAKSIGNLRGERGVLQLIVKKGARNLIELMIRTEKDQSVHQGYTLDDDRSTVTGKFSAINVTAQGHTYWMVPQDTSAFINAMGNTKELEAKSVGGRGNTRFSFSTKGLATIIGEMKSQCLENVGASNATYELEFINKSTHIDLSRIEVEEARTMRSAFFSGLKLHLDKRQNREELAQLRQKFQAAADEFDQLGVLIDQLTTKVIPKIEADIAEQVAAQKAAEDELPKRRAEIPALQRSADAAKLHMEKMEAIVAPIRPEHQMRVENLERAHSDLNRSERDLADLRVQISNNEMDLRAMENEVYELQRRIPQLNYDLVAARGAHQRAENALRRFDRPMEIARERRNPQNVNGVMITYDQAQRDVDAARPEVNRRDAELIARRGDLSRAEAALRECQATAGRDCTSQQQAVNAAKISVNLAQEQLNSARNELEKRQEIFKKVDKSINKKVDRIEDELKESERQTRAIRDRLETELMAATNRVNTLNTYEIPSRRNLISSQRSQARSLENLIYRQRQDVDLRTHELADFKTRTGWDSKKQNLDNATIDYNQKADRLNQVVSRERALVKIIDFAKAELPRLRALLAEKQDLLARSTDRKAALTLEIKPYLDAKAASDAFCAGLDSQLAELRKTFETAAK